MARPRLTDPNDPRLDAFRDLVGHDRGRWVVIEGELAVQRALLAGAPVEIIVAEPARAARLESTASVSVLEADRSLLRAITGFDFHRGVLAAMPRPHHEPDLDPAFVERARARGRSTTLVAAGLADPANVGAVIRSARAFDADLVVVDRRGADPLGRKAIRASAGWVFSQPMWLGADVVEALTRLRTELGTTIVATAPNAGVALDRLERPDHLALVVGNEGEGLDPRILALAAATVHIPMAHGVDSLNVATAAGIFLWSLTRSRGPSE